MTATGGTAMQHNDGDVQHDNSDGRLIAIHRYCVEVVTIDRGCIDLKKKKKNSIFFLSTDLIDMRILSYNHLVHI